MSNSVPWGSPIRLLRARDGLGADYGASRPARFGLAAGLVGGRGRPLRAISLMLDASRARLTSAAALASVPIRVVLANPAAILTNGAIQLDTPCTPFWKLDARISN